MFACNSVDLEDLGPPYDYYGPHFFSMMAPPWRIFFESTAVPEDSLPSAGPSVRAERWSSVSNEWTILRLFRINSTLPFRGFTSRAVNNPSLLLNSLGEESLGLG